MYITQTNVTLIPTSHSTASSYTWCCWNFPLSPATKACSKVLSSWHTSLSLPASAAEKTGGNVERLGVPGRREGAGPAWPNLGLDVTTSASHLGPWAAPHVWIMKPDCWWSHPLQERGGENNSLIYRRVSLSMLMGVDVGWGLFMESVCVSEVPLFS